MSLWPLEGHKRPRMPESCHLLCTIWMEPPAYPASILPLSLYHYYWKHLTVVDTAFFFMYQIHPFYGRMLQQHQSCKSLTTPVCWGCCRTEWKIRYFLTADRVHVANFIQMRSEIMQWLILVVKCSHSQVSVSILDRSLDPPFHESSDTHFTFWEDRIKSNIKAQICIYILLLHLIFLSVRRLWFHSLAE